MSGTQVPPEPTGGSPTGADPVTAPADAPHPDGPPPAEAPPAAAGSMSAMASSAGQAVSTGWGRLGGAERLIVVGGFGVALLYLLGVVLEVLATQSSWLVASVAGVAAGVIALLPADRRMGWPVPALVVVAAAAIAAASITVVEGLEMLSDFQDDLDDGGPMFVGLVTLSAVSGVVTAVGADRLATPAVSSGVGATLRATDRGARVALAGALVFLLGWVISVTIGVFGLNFQGSVLIAAVAGGSACLLVGAAGWRIAATWVVAGCAAVGTLVGLAILVDFVDEATRIGAGPDLLWPFLVMLAGLAVFVAGAALMVADERLRLTRTVG
jgi:hypothetical protein